MRAMLKMVQLAIALVLVILIFMPWFEAGIGGAGLEGSGFDLVRNAYDCTIGARSGCGNADYAGWVVALAGALLVIGLLLFMRSGMPMMYRLICSVLYLLVPIYVLYAVGQEGDAGLLGEVGRQTGVGLGDMLTDVMWEMYSTWLKLALLLAVVVIFVPSED